MVAKANSGRTQGRSKWQKERIPEFRLAWAEFQAGKLAINKYTETVEGEDAEAERIEVPELGEAISLMLHSHFENRTIKFHLTGMTAPELEAFERVIQHAINLARPTVEHRDNLAREALANGDDSHERCYRGVPTLVVRHGQVE